MLPKQNRLTEKKDFERIFKEGKGFKEDFLILKFVPNNLNRNRFGIIVSPKISKKATLRNKIKKQLRELIKSRLSKLIEGKDIILIALPGLETKDFWEMEEIVNKIFTKAGISNSI